MTNREITEALVEFYKEHKSKEELEAFAAKYQITYRSAVSRLSKAGVYTKKTYVTKTGEPPITKEEMVVKLAELLNIGSHELDGLEKAPKAVIQKLINIEMGIFN